MPFSGELCAHKSTIMSFIKTVVFTALPDLNAPGAVKTGEAELVAGVVLKNTKMSGILNDIKIAPTA